MKCTGCRICEMSCSLKNYGEVNTDISNIKVFTFFPGIDIPMFCFKCSDAPCIYSCPFQALSKDKNGCVVVNHEKCTGCGVCINGCRARVINLHPKLNYPMICNDCGGFEPECVKNCPAKALDFVELPFDGKHLAKIKERIYLELSKNAHSTISTEVMEKAKTIENEINNQRTSMEIMKKTKGIYGG